MPTVEKGQPGQNPTNTQSEEHFQGTTKAEKKTSLIFQLEVFRNKCKKQLLAAAPEGFALTKKLL